MSCCLGYETRGQRCCNGCRKCCSSCCCTGCCCVEQKQASLVPRQCILPRSCNPCIRPCCTPQCVNTYCGCRAFRPKYCQMRPTGVCYPQLPPKPRTFSLPRCIC